MLAERISRAVKQNSLHMLSYCQCFAAMCSQRISANHYLQIADKTLREESFTVYQGID
tara:strand:+ start:25 stop:198 length:174 start_codon:yes stop_codon:yes gene_type:complete